MTEKKKIMPYYQSVKFLRRWLKPNTVVYFDELMDQHKRWRDNSKDFQRITGYPFKGVFFLSRARIAENINLKKGAQIAAESILIEMGLLKVIHQDDHPNWYKLNLIKLEELYKKYLDEEAKKKAEKSIKVFPPNYAELIADYKDLDEGSDNTQVGPSLENGSAPIQKVDRSKNRRLKTYNKNIVCNDTDCAEAPKSLHSCIKDKESAQSPPSAHAQSGRDAEIHEIMDQYNAAMGIKNVANGDYDTVSQHLEEYRKLKKDFTPLGLAYAWKNFPDKGARKKLTTPRIATIVSYNLMDIFLSRQKEIYTYCADTLDFKLDKLFKYYQDYLNQIDPEKYHVNFIGELSMNGSSDCLYGKSHREERYNIYKQYIEPKLLQNEDLHDMMIDMEVS